MLPLPAYLLAKHWDYQPFLPKREQQRYLALYTAEADAARLAELYCLAPPAGVGEVTTYAELLAWLKAAQSAGASAVWIDAILDCQHVHPAQQIPITRAIAQTVSAIEQTL